MADHREDVNEFRTESTTGDDPDVKAFASKTLPTLEDHLKMAQDTAKAVVGTTGTVSKSRKGSRRNRLSSNDSVRLQADHAHGPAKAGHYVLAGFRASCAPTPRR